MTTKLNLTEDFKQDFVDGFESTMPDWWENENDYESSTPWGCPWEWADESDWYIDTLSAEEMGKAWARRCLPEIKKLHAEELALAEDDAEDAE